VVVEAVANRLQRCVRFGRSLRFELSTSRTRGTRVNHSLFLLMLIILCAVIFSNILENIGNKEMGRKSLIVLGDAFTRMGVMETNL